MDACLPPDQPAFSYAFEQSVMKPCRKRFEEELYTLHCSSSSLNRTAHILR